MIKLNYMEERNKKMEEYAKYIDDHIERVQIAYANLISINPQLLRKICEDYMDCKNYDNYDALLKRVQYNIINHDKSKYSDEEFLAYRKNFYPVDDREKEENKKDFEKAWKHHYENNTHHWEYWKKKDAKTNKDTDYNKMSLIAMLEMICDWMAMSSKFNNTVIEWYSKEKDNIKLHPYTRHYVEILIDYITTPIKSIE